MVLDLVFASYYKTFQIVFQDCDQGFRRQIIGRSKFEFLYCSSNVESVGEIVKWPSKDVKP